LFLNIWPSREDLLELLHVHSRRIEKLVVFGTDEFHDLPARQQVEFSVRRPWFREGLRIFDHQAVIEAGTVAAKPFVSMQCVARPESHVVHPALTIETDCIDD